VLRGGVWLYFYASHARCAYRDYGNPDDTLATPLAFGV
jgi:hypothetical protein